MTENTEMSLESLSEIEPLQLTDEQKAFIRHNTVVNWDAVNENVVDVMIKAMLHIGANPRLKEGQEAIIGMAMVSPLRLTYGDGKIINNIIAAWLDEAFVKVKLPSVPDSLIDQAIALSLDVDDFDDRADDHYDEDWRDRQYDRDEEIDYEENRHI